MRLSTYTILSSRLDGGGYVLMNGVTGALDWLSDDLGAKLERALASRRDDILPALRADTMRTWRERGHLTELSEDDERAVVVTLAEDAHARMARKPGFMIVPNLDCNYRCTYCFERPLQNTLKSAGAEITHRKGNVVLRREQVAWIYDGMAQVKVGIGAPPGGMVILYGGEPLDRNNRDVVIAIIDEGLRRDHHFAAVTNGHDLDAYMDCLGQGLIEQVQISIDGPKHVHDTRRVYVGKESSFDAIIANTRRILVETDTELQIRIHMDPSNIALFDETLDIFEAEGWFGHPNVVMYANTVYERTADGGVAARIEHGDIDDELARMAARAPNIFTSAPEIHAIRASSPAFDAGERFGLKGTYCAANSGNYIFAPDGKIYSCWESVGKACSRIGAYDVDGVHLDHASSNKWFGRSIATQPTCQTCAYALACGGGCAQFAEYETGDLYASYCDDFQRVFRNALARSATRRLAGVPSGTTKAVLDSAVIGD